MNYNYKVKLYSLVNPKTTYYSYGGP